MLLLYYDRGYIDCCRVNCSWVVCTTAVIVVTVFVVLIVVSSSRHWRAGRTCSGWQARFFSSPPSFTGSLDLVGLSFFLPYFHIICIACVESGLIIWLLSVILQKVRGNPGPRRGRHPFVSSTATTSGRAAWSPMVPSLPSRTSVLTLSPVTTAWTPRNHPAMPTFQLVMEIRRKRIKKI